MHCRRCNKEASEGEKHCRKCGIQLEDGTDILLPDIEKKKRRWRDLAWWNVNFPAVRHEADNYFKIKYKSSRAVSAYCLLFATTTTILFIFIWDWPEESFLEAIIFLALAIFIYLGHRWAMILAMLLWTIEKFFMIYSATGNPLMQILWWNAFMVYFYRAFKVEQYRKEIFLKLKRGQSVAQEG